MAAATMAHATGWSAMLGGGLLAKPQAASPWDVRLMQMATRWTLVLAALTVMALVLTWLLRQGSFAIQRIRLDAELHRTSVATIRANALPRLEGNFFTMDLQAARRAFE